MNDAVRCERMVVVEITDNVVRTYTHSVQWLRTTRGQKYLPTLAWTLDLCCRLGSLHLLANTKPVQHMLLHVKLPIYLSFRPKLPLNHRFTSPLGLPMWWVYPSHQPLWVTKRPVEASQTSPPVRNIANYGKHIKIDQDRREHETRLVRSPLLISTATLMADHFTRACECILVPLDSAYDKTSIPSPISGTNRRKPHKISESSHSFATVDRRDTHFLTHLVDISFSLERKYFLYSLVNSLLWSWLLLGGVNNK